MPNAEIATEKVELDWNQMGSDAVIGEPGIKAPEQVEKKEDVIATDVVETPEQIAEKAKVIETQAAEALALETSTKEAAEALKTEAKALGLPETSTKEEIEAFKTKDELSLDEAEAPVVYPENSFKAIAQKLGSDIKEDTADAFKEVYITKEEAAKQALITKESIFSGLSPKTAAMLEMIELGVPEHLINEPTKEIDGYLALDDAALIRAELATNPLWTEDRINTEIESLLEDPKKLEHEAFKIRSELTIQKNAITAEENNIIQKWTEQKQAATIKAQELERTAVKDALSKVSEVAGVKIPAKVMDAISIKYANGAYDKDLLSPVAKAEYIIQKELGQKAVNLIRNKASENAKLAVTTKLLNIPEIKTAGGGGKPNQTTNIEDNWGPIEKDFG